MCIKKKAVSRSREQVQHPEVPSLLFFPWQTRAEIKTHFCQATKVPLNGDRGNFPTLDGFTKFLLVICPQVHLYCKSLSSAEPTTTVSHWYFWNVCFAFIFYLEHSLRPKSIVSIADLPGPVKPRKCGSLEMGISSKHRPEIEKWQEMIQPKTLSTRKKINIEKNNKKVPKPRLQCWACCRGKPLDLQYSFGQIYRGNQMSIVCGKSKSWSCI